MPQKSYRKQEGDSEVISDDGLTMHVYRANGRRITVDMSENETGAVHPHEQPSEEFQPEVIENDTGAVIQKKGAPLWVDEIAPVLKRFDGSTKGNHQEIDQKKKRTVLALAEAEYLSESKTAVFNRKDTCSPTTYYNKWRTDPLFSSILVEVLGIVRAFKDEEEIRHIYKAVSLIRGAAPEAARVHIELMNNPNPFVALQASAKILNMASQETADKARSPVVINLDAGQLADAADEALEQLRVWEQQQEQQQIEKEIESSESN